MHRDLRLKAALGPMTEKLSGRAKDDSQMVEA